MLPAVTVETEASQMLEAALEQMDDIIAGKKSVSVIQKGCWKKEKKTQENVCFVGQKKKKPKKHFS